MYATEAIESGAEITQTYGEIIKLIKRFRLGAFNIKTLQSQFSRLSFSSPFSPAFSSPFSSPFSPARYGNLSGDGRLSRQENMRESWGFSCTCVRCRLQYQVTASSSAAPSLSSPFLLKEAARVAYFDRTHVCQCGGVAVPAVSLGRVSPTWRCGGAAVWQ